MTDSNSGAGSAAPAPSKKTKKRGAFPRLSLKSVLELVDGMYELGHGDPVRRRTAFEHIGRSPDSSTSYALIAAANGGYGLIKGGKNATHLELTPTGAAIAKGKGTSRKRAAIDVLFENEYFGALVDKFSDRPLPLDSIATDFLEREHDLEPSDAAMCWTTAKDNVFDFGLFEESGNKQVILPRDHAHDAVAVDPEPPAEEESTEAEVGHHEAGSHPEESETVVESTATPNERGTARAYQVAFNIQVVLPENATAETYDAIFQSISKNLLGDDRE